jgi:Mor family transcriptional regulator
MKNRINHKCKYCDNILYLPAHKVCANCEGAKRWCKIKKEQRLKRNDKIYFWYKKGKSTKHLSVKYKMAEFHIKRIIRITEMA